MIPTGKSDYLILYRSANREKALSLAGELRNQNKSTRLMRKDADTSLQIYKEYGQNNAVHTIFYIDDTGETTEIDLTADGIAENGGTV